MVLTSEAKWASGKPTSFHQTSFLPGDVTGLTENELEQPLPPTDSVVLGPGAKASLRCARRVPRMRPWVSSSRGFSESWTEFCPEPRVTVEPQDPLPTSPAAFIVTSQELSPIRQGRRVHIAWKAERSKLLKKINVSIAFPGAKVNV